MITRSCMCKLHPEVDLELIICDVCKYPRMTQRCLKEFYNLIQEECPYRIEDYDTFSKMYAYNKNSETAIKPYTSGLRVIGHLSIDDVIPIPRELLKRMSDLIERGNKIEGNKLDE